MTYGVSVLLGTVGLVVTLVIVGGGTKPVPVRFTSNAVPTEVSLLAMWMAAVFAPNAVGANCTTIVALPLAAMLPTGDVVTVKFAPFVPSMVTPVILSAAVLLVLRMTNVFESVLPTFTLPYATVLVPSVSPVPLGCSTAICDAAAAGPV